MPLIRSPKYMKPHLAITIFLALIVPAVATSWGSYKITEANIINDLNQALARTIQQKDVSIITPDTLSTYRRFLSTPALKSRVYLAHCPRIERGNAVCSDTMIGNPKLPTLGIRAYASCTQATIFGMSDQRLPMTLLLLSLVWGAYSLHMCRRNRPGLTAIGRLTYEHSSRCFYNARHEQLHLTPLQQQLMEMFVSHPDHQLAIHEICAALWPKKEDAHDTLYTLIRRLRPIVEKDSDLKIVSEKGRFYRLEDTRP